MTKRYPQSVFLHKAESKVQLVTVSEREMFYLTMHSTHFIYGYMASDIWLRTILIVRKETRCRHIGYSYQLTARVVLYAPSHRHDNTYHSLCYTSHGALAGTRKTVSVTYHHSTISECSYHGPIPGSQCSDEACHSTECM